MRTAACLAGAVLIHSGFAGAQEAGPSVATLNEVRSLQARGKYRATLPLLDRFIRDDPDFREALGLRTITYASLGRRIPALDDFQRFLELNPTADEFQQVARVVAKAFAIPPSDESGDAPVLVYRIFSRATEWAIKRGSGMRFILDAEIRRNGRVGEIKVVRADIPDGANPRTLLEAVIQAVREWRYVPGSIDGRPTVVHATIVYRFH